MPVGVCSALAEGPRLLDGLGGSGCEAEVGERRVSRARTGESEPGELGGKDMVAGKGDVLRRDEDLRFKRQMALDFLVPHQNTGLLKKDRRVIASQRLTALDDAWPADAIDSPGDMRSGGTAIET